MPKSVPQPPPLPENAAVVRETAGKNTGKITGRRRTEKRPLLTPAPAVIAAVSVPAAAMPHTPNRVTAKSQRGRATETSNNIKNRGKKTLVSVPSTKSV